MLLSGNAFSTTYNPPSLFPGSSSGAHIQAPQAPRSTYAPQQSTIAQMPYNVAVHNNRRNNSTVSGRGRECLFTIAYFLIIRSKYPFVCGCFTVWNKLYTVLS